MFRSVPFLAALIGFSSPSFAAEAIQTDWVKQCAKTTSTTRCVTISHVSEVGGKLDVAVALVATPDASKDYIRIAAPLGLQLVHGLRLVMDDDKSVYKFHHCRSEGCVANIVDLKIAEKMRKAKELSVQMIKSDGSVLSAKFSMANFKTAESNKLVSLKTKGGSEQDKMDFDVFLGDPPKSTTTEEFTVPLAFSGWSKFCNEKACFVGMDGKLSTGGNMIGAVLIEPKDNNDKKRILRITLPLKFYLPKKPQLSIDGFSPLTSDFVICFNNGCMIDFDEASLLNALKSSKEMSITATTTQGDAWRAVIPLSSFSKAYDGPSVTEEAVKETVKKQTEQVKRSGKRLERWKGPKMTLYVSKGFAPEP
jgi:invasion protein IalB